MSPLTVATQGKEVDKPSGGGHGPDAVYIVDVSIDGEHALSLRRNDFKQTGQMARFVEIIEAMEARLSK